MRSLLTRQRLLIDHAFASLARHKSLNLGLLLVDTLIIFSLASVLLFSHALKHEGAILLSKAPDLVLQGDTLGRHELIPSRYLPGIQSITGVGRVQGRLWGYFFDPVVAANYTLQVPLQNTPAPGQVIIGSGVARSRGAAVGDVLAFRGYDGTLYPFTVSGILPNDTDIVSADLMLLAEEDFRGFFGITPDYFTDFVITLTPDARVGEVGGRLTGLFPDTRIIDRRGILATYRALFGWGDGMMLILLVGALLALIIFIVQKASGLSAEERREVGILKAVGWDTSDIIMLKLWEGFLITAPAFLLGYNLAYWHVFGASSILLQPLIMGWSSLSPELHLIPYLDALQLAVLCLGAVFPAVVASVGPVWRAATVSPDRLV
jgi:ABC-type lipoprotein release transport system permease subunit